MNSTEQSRQPRRIYCDGPTTPALEALARDGRVELVRFASDEASGGVQRVSEMRDLNLKFSQLPGGLGGYRGSPRYEEILTAIGFQRRREAVQLDLAAGEGCSAFVTEDPDILRHKARLQQLLGMRFFHPSRDQAELLALVGAERPSG